MIETGKAVCGRLGRRKALGAEALGERRARPSYLADDVAGWGPLPARDSAKMAHFFVKAFVEL